MKYLPKRFLNFLPYRKNSTKDNVMEHVYLIHYDNTTHEPEFYVFSTFERAKKRVREMTGSERDENGELVWKPIESDGIEGLWQWTDNSEYISIWKLAINEIPAIWNV